MPVNNKSTKPTRNTLRNFIKLASSGQIIELLKVLRRRTINSARFLKHTVLKPVRLVYLWLEPSFITRRRGSRRLNRILEKYFSYNLSRPLDPSKIKVALIIRDGLTHPKSSAFIRLISVLTSESMQKHVSLKIFPENTRSIAPEFDVCIVQRNAFDTRKQADSFLHDIKSKNIRLVFDTDDAFRAIDKSHPEHDIQIKRAEAVRPVLEQASQVWASTSELKRQLQKQTPTTVTVVPNSVDLRIWSLKQPKSTKKPLTMVYMGTGTHDADFVLILPALDALAVKNPNSFTLTIIGVGKKIPDRPWLKRLSPPSSMYPEFAEWFQAQSFDIGLSPLQKTPFNDAKSDIKCLDYLAAGMLPIVSDVKAYANKDLDDFVIRLQNTTKAWLDTLSDILQDEDFQAKKSNKVQKAQKYMEEKRSSAKTAKTLASLLEA